MTGLADRLAERTLELVDIPSESRHEERIRTHLLERVPAHVTAEYAGDDAFLFVPQRRADAPLVVLAGHYDTVPAQANIPGRIEVDAVHGLGASDMKGGVAVAVELVRDLASVEAGRLRRRACSCSAARSFRPSTIRSPRSSTARARSTTRLSRSCSSLRTGRCMQAASVT